MSGWKETRRRKLKVSKEKIQEMDAIIQEKGVDGCNLTCEQLEKEVDFDLPGDIIRQAMHSLEYGKYIACSTAYISPKLAKRRLQYCQYMLAKYLEPEDWKGVRFSNELHFGWREPQGQV